MNYEEMKCKKCGVKVKTEVRRTHEIVGNFAYSILYACAYPKCTKFNHTLNVESEVEDRCPSEIQGYV